MADRKAVDRIIAQLKAAQKKLCDVAEAMDDARSVMRDAEVLIDVMADEIDDTGSDE